jgi:EpsI family protein
MTKSDNSNRIFVTLAALAAGFAIIVFTAAYRILAIRLEASVNTSSLPPDALEQLPLKIGGWTGQEAPLDEKIIRATDTDAHISRSYSRYNSTEYISLFIAYGVRARDLMPHRPEVCYIGSGWTRIDKRTLKLPLSGGKELPCNILQFSRGTLDTKKTLVLNYYIVDGQYCHDVSRVRSKAWRGSGMVRYVAQVQIATSITMSLNASSAEKEICAFAVDSAPSIYNLFQSLENIQLSDEARSDTNYTFGGIGID